MYDELGIFWLDGDGDESDLFDSDWDDDEELGNIFGDIVKGVGKIVTAPVDLVAKALPKPMRKAAGVALGGPAYLAHKEASKMFSKKKKRKRKSTRRRPTTRRRKGKVSLSSLARAGVGGSKSRDELLKAMVGVLGAKDIIKTAASTKPRLAARSTGKGGKGASQAAAIYAAAVAKKLAPDLKSINKKLALAQNQRLATSEHLAINNTTAFRRKVLKDLMNMSQCLPTDHPTRARIRRVGIMSGLL